MTGLGLAMVVAWSLGCGVAGGMVVSLWRDVRCECKPIEREEVGK